MGHKLTRAISNYGLGRLAYYKPVSKPLFSWSALWITLKKTLRTPFFTLVQFSEIWPQFGSFWSFIFQKSGFLVICRYWITISTWNFECRYRKKFSIDWYAYCLGLQHNFFCSNRVPKMKFLGFLDRVLQQWVVKWHTEMITEKFSIFWYPDCQNLTIG